MPRTLMLWMWLILSEIPVHKRQGHIIIDLIIKSNMPEVVSFKVPPIRISATILKESQTVRMPDTWTTPG